MQNHCISTVGSLIVSIIGKPLYMYGRFSNWEVSFEIHCIGTVVFVIGKFNENHCVGTVGP